MQRAWFRIAAFITVGLLTSLAFAPLAQAQVVTSEVRGTVIDQNGQPIVGAQVSVTDTRTNVTRGALTNDNGRYFVHPDVGLTSLTTFRPQ